MGDDQPPSLASADWLRRPETQAVLRVLAAGGYEGRVVGGAVRNALIGKAVTDIDIATSAPPEETMRLAGAAGFGVVPTGLAHGTVTVIVDHHPFEVTTLREDVETFGRHATVSFTADWAADARRRDFTINALYCAADGTVHDPLGGLADLRDRRVRFIGDAGERIREDYLRILRFFRFHAEYATGPLDAVGIRAAVRARDGLARLSGERVRQELLKLLVAPGAVAALEQMASHGLLTALLPVAPRLPVMARLVEREATAGRPPDAILRLAALGIAVAEDVPRLAARLRLSNEERERLGHGALRTALDPSTGEAVRRAALYRLDTTAWRTAVLMNWANAGEAGNADAWRTLLDLPDRWALPQLPVQGRDVLALGVPPGPDVGRLLALLEAEWVAADFPDERDRLLARLAELARKP